MSRQGIRADWEAIPPSTRAHIDEIAGSPIISATNLEGGFSPGPAARCELQNGGRVFVKAAGTELNPTSPALHRRQRRAGCLRRLPDSPIAARLTPGLPTVRAFQATQSRIALAWLSERLDR